MAMMKDMTNVGPLKYDNELSELEVIEISLFLHQLLTNECTSSLTQAVQNSPLSCVCGVHLHREARARMGQINKAATICCITLFFPYKFRMIQ